MIFQAANVHESASLFNLKEKKIDKKDMHSKIRTHDPDGPVSTPTPTPKKNLTSFKTVLNPNQ